MTTGPRAMSPWGRNQAGLPGALGGLSVPYVKWGELTFLPLVEQIQLASEFKWLLQGGVCGGLDGLGRKVQDGGCGGREGKAWLSLPPCPHALDRVHRS